MNNIENWVKPEIILIVVEETNGYKSPGTAENIESHS